jgi:hypothetical protein
MQTLWESLGRLPSEEPREELRERFYGMLHAYRGGDTRVSARRDRAAGWLSRLFSGRPAVRLTFGLGLLVLGIAAGYRLKGERSDGTELAQLHDEVRGVSRLLIMSLLQQESASERLRGVSWSYRTAEPDAEINGALLEALKYDPNVNVRLAALDALSRNLSQPDLRQDLLRSLPKQSSPLVQAAIVDLMIELHEKSSLDILRQMVRDTTLNGSVKKKIEQGIQQLI